MNVYNLDRPVKGLAHIINNLHSEQKQTQNDVIKLEKMFKRIKVQVEPVKTNQDKKELEIFASNLKCQEMDSFNIFFLVVISHGLQGFPLINQSVCHGFGFIN
jgi:hypothetical protein